MPKWWISIQATVAVWVLSKNIHTAIILLWFQNEIYDGQVILVNSMSGHRLSPLGGKTRFYSATKFAVTALLEGRYVIKITKYFNL